MSVWFQRFNSSWWKSSSFQIIAGMLSGPKALEGFKNSVAVLSSLMVKGDVSIGKVSDIGTLGYQELLHCSQKDS